MPAKHNKNHTFICCLSLSTWFSDIFFWPEKRELRAASINLVSRFTLETFLKWLLWTLIRNICACVLAWGLYQGLTFEYSIDPFTGRYRWRFLLIKRHSCLNQYTFSLILFYLYIYELGTSIHKIWNSLTNVLWAEMRFKITNNNR